MFNPNFAKTEITSKNGSLDFGDLKSGINRPNKYSGFGGRDWYVETLNGEDRQVINDDPDLQLGTGYQQYDFTQKLVYEVNYKLNLMANFQYSTSSDVPRYDALTELRDGLPRYAEWNYGPQNRFLSTLQAKWKSPNPLFDKVKVIVAFNWGPGPTTLYDGLKSFIACLNDIGSEILSFKMFLVNHHEEG